MARSGVPLLAGRGRGSQRGGGLVTLGSVASPLIGTNAGQAVDDHPVVGPRPSRTTRRVRSTSGPSVTYFCTAPCRRVRSRRRTCAPARCRARRRERGSHRMEPTSGTRARANMPGVKMPLSFLNTARPRMVPEERSITLSTKSIRPWCAKSCSSIRRRSTRARAVPGRDFRGRSTRRARSAGRTLRRR